MDVSRTWGYDGHCRNVPMNQPTHKGDSIMATQWTEIRQRDMDAWLANRIDSAKRLMPLFDALPKAVREALSHNDSGPSWHLIRMTHAMHTNGRTEKQLLSFVRRELTAYGNKAAAKGLVIKRQSITLADLEI